MFHEQFFEDYTIGYSRRSFGRTITKADIESSVLSVPPLARRADYSIDRDGNAKILAHLRAGGGCQVRTL